MSLKECITVGQLIANLSDMPLDAKIVLSRDGPPPPAKRSDRNPFGRLLWGVRSLNLGFRTEVASAVENPYEGVYIFRSSQGCSEPETVVVLYGAGGDLPQASMEDEDAG